MSYDLGPFQNLVGISFPQGLTLIKLEDVGECTVADYADTFGLNCDCADYPADCAAFNVTGYYNAFSWELSAKLVTCEQVGYIVTGRTSGATVECGGLELAALFGLDCAADNCWLGKGAGKYVGNDWWGSWVGGAFDRWDGDMNVITPSALGFIASERIDLWLGQKELAIVSITEQSPTALLIELNEAHNQSFDCDIEISGTVNYDGLYTVSGVAGTVLLNVSTPYIADEFTGKVIPRYDQ